MGLILSKDTLLTKVKDPSTVSTSSTGITSTLDMQGYDAVMFFTSYGKASATTLMHAQCCDTTSGTFEDIAGSEIDSTGGSDEDQFIDIVRPPKRYVQAALSRASTSAIGDVWAIQYRCRTNEQDNITAGTINGKTLVDPATGTK